MGFHQRDLRRLKQMHKKTPSRPKEEEISEQEEERGQRAESSRSNQSLVWSWNRKRAAVLTQTDAAGRPTGGGWADVVQTALVKLGTEEETRLVRTRLNLQPPPCSTVIKMGCR